MRHTCWRARRAARSCRPRAGPDAGPRPARARQDPSGCSTRSPRAPLRARRARPRRPGDLAPGRTHRGRARTARPDRDRASRRSASPSALRDLGRALGDETRMRLLQLIKGGAAVAAGAVRHPRRARARRCSTTSRCCAAPGCVDLSVTAGEANVYRLRPEGFEQLGSGGKGILFALRCRNISTPALPFGHAPCLRRAPGPARRHRLLRLGLGLAPTPPSRPTPEPVHGRALRDRAGRRGGAVRRDPHRPVGLTTTEDGAVWVVGAQSETVLRIPAGATEPDLTVDVPGVPLRTTTAFGIGLGDVVRRQGAAAARPGHRRGGRDDQDRRRARGGRDRVRLDLGGRPGRRQAAAHRPRHQRRSAPRSSSEVGARLVDAGAGRDVRRALRRQH